MLVQTYWQRYIDLMGTKHNATGTDLQVKLAETTAQLRQQLTTEPKIGLILGSGLGAIAELLEDPVTIAYEDIVHFPVSTVEGHAGALVAGRIAGKDVLMMNGRFHLYEGYDVSTVAYPIRVMKQLGIETMMVTNAAGGVNTDYAVGDLMLIRDHLNLMYRNPLIGPNEDSIGVRFPDMSEGYSNKLRLLAKHEAEQLNIPLREGIYAGMLGPCYETPAEIRMLRIMGADAVGMSTVPEVIAARHAGLEVMGISCITNKAAGLEEQALSHVEVMETAERVKQTFMDLVVKLIAKI